MNKILKNSGFTLLELLLVIGIGALLVIGSMALYQVIFINVNTSKTMGLVYDIRQTMHEIYQGQSTYGYAVTPPATINMVGVLQQEGVIAADGNHPFRGNVNVVVLADRSGFYVQLEDIPASACAKIVTSLAVDPDAESVRRISLEPADTDVTLDGTNQVANIVEDCFDAVDATITLYFE